MGKYKPPPVKYKIVSIIFEMIAIASFIVIRVL